MYAPIFIYINFIFFLILGINLKIEAVGNTDASLISAIVTQTGQLANYTGQEWGKLQVDAQGKVVQSANRVSKHIVFFTAATDIAIDLAKFLLTFSQTITSHQGFFNEVKNGSDDYGSYFYTKYLMGSEMRTELFPEMYYLIAFYLQNVIIARELTIINLRAINSAGTVPQLFSQAASALDNMVEATELAADVVAKLAIHKKNKNDIQSLDLYLDL